MNGQGQDPRSGGPERLRHDLYRDDREDNAGREVQSAVQGGRYDATMTSDSAIVAKVERATGFDLAVRSPPPTGN